MSLDELVIRSGKCGNRRDRRQVAAFVLPRLELCLVLEIVGLPVMMATRLRGDGRTGGGRCRAYDDGKQ